MEPLYARAHVAVIGDGAAAPDGERYRLARDLGAGIIERGHRLITGGLGGVMEGACRGARESASWSEGRIIGIVPGGDRLAANGHVDVGLATSLGHLRNALVAQADAVIAVGGGAGTLSELALAWIHDRLVIALRCGGWSERVADERLDERVRFATIEDDRVHGAADASEALALLDRLLPRYLAGAKA